MAPHPNLASFEIEGDLAGADDGAIEVRLRMTDGHERWCFFMTPAALSRCGDWLTGTRVRIHLGVPHMIVVSEIDLDIVRIALEDLDRAGQLFEHSLAVSSS